MEIYTMEADGSDVKRLTRRAGPDGGPFWSKDGKLIVFRGKAMTDAKELEEYRTLLKDVVFLVAPLVNADGNERISVENRPDQAGPPQGVGVRENAQGLDLNRDFVKLDTPEIRALVRHFNRWHPAVTIDCHTTNGSYHRYALTYDSPRHPATHAEIIRYTRDAFLPEVSRRLGSGEILT